MRTIKITKTALSAMLPQASILNLTTEELNGAEITIQDLVNAERNSADFGDNGQENNRLRFKLSSNKTSKPIVLNVNQFLRLPISGEPTKTVLDRLQEDFAAGDEIEFPKKFTITDVKPRVETVNNKEHEVYPSYMYEKMEEHVASFRKSFKTLSETGRLPKNAGGDSMSEREYVGQAYADYEVIRSLPGSKLLERYEGKAEPIKTFSVELS